MNRRGQAFIIDYVVGIILFLVILIAGIVLIVDIIPDSSYQELYRENSYLTDKLLEPGFPLNWTNTSVLVPGFTENQRINDTKLAEFRTLTYTEQKIYLQLSGEYVAFFRNSTDIISYDSTCLYGFPLPYNATTCEPDFSSLSYKHLIKNERIVILAGDPTFLEVYSWS